MVFLCSHDVNKLIGYLFAVAQEKDCKDRNHQDSGEGCRCGLFYLFQSALDIRAMALQEGPDLTTIYRNDREGSRLFELRPDGAGS